MTNIAIENGPVEIVDLPNDSMVIFQFVILNYQRVWPTGVNLDIEKIYWMGRWLQYTINIPFTWYTIFQYISKPTKCILKDIERYWKMV